MTEDTATDLAAWIAHRDEAAFRRMVQTHGGMVSAACRRQLGDGDAADEAVQAVFIILARRASAVSDPSALGPWLYGVVLGVCRHARRAAATRARHEQEAAMRTVEEQRATASGSSDWADVRPWLDDAIATLHASERAVVIGHFLDGLPQAAVAASLGISESAARRRITTAVDKMRSWFSKHGMRVGASVLVAGLASEASAAGPALTAACTQAALHPASAVGASALANGSLGIGSAKLAAVLALAGILLLAVAVALHSGFSLPKPPGETAPPAAPAEIRGSPAVARPRWTNGLPADTGFFPIGVWFQSPRTAEAYRQAGVNLYLGQWTRLSGTDLAVLSSAGMRVICDPDAIEAEHRDDGTIVGWMNHLEPDDAREDADGTFRAPMDPDAVLHRREGITVQDGSRPICLFFDQGAAWSGYPGRGNRSDHPEDYAAYAAGADILGFHVYPVNETRSEVSGNLWYVPLGVDRLRNASSGLKPVWAWIECSRIHGSSAAKPTPEQVRSEVWMALIHGASGIVYFPHVLDPMADEAALLHDPVMLPAITALNRQIASLAPALNSPTVPEGASVSSSDPAVPIDVMVKAVAGSRYVFAAAMRAGRTTATFAVAGPASGQVEVLGENRRLSVVDGRFDDQFQPYAVHLYRLPIPARSDP